MSSFLSFWQTVQLATDSIVFLESLKRKVQLTAYGNFWCFKLIFAWQPNCAALFTSTDGSSFDGPFPAFQGYPIPHPPPFLALGLYIAHHITPRCVPRYLSNKLSKYLHHQQHNCKANKKKKKQKLKHKTAANRWENIISQLFWLARIVLVSFSAFRIMFSLFFIGLKMRSLAHSLRFSVLLVFRFSGFLVSVASRFLFVCATYGHKMLYPRSHMWPAAWLPGCLCICLILLALLNRWEMAFKLKRRGSVDFNIS